MRSEEKEKLSSREPIFGHTPHAHLASPEIDQ
jgi:hypothetical protein